MERKFVVFFNKTFHREDRSITGIRIEIRDKDSGEVVCPDQQIDMPNYSYAEFEEFARKASFDSNRQSYVIEVKWEEIRSLFSAINRPALENCIRAAEDWITERGKED
jgi:hypothetical protein